MQDSSNLPIGVYPSPYPLPWAVVRGFRGLSSDLFRCSFRAPFFSRLGSPQNRYHKLFRRQNGPDLESKTGSKTSSHFGTVFVSSFCRFCDFLHTTSSASRIARAISKPHFRLSSFLLFLLSLRLSFRRLFGYEMMPKWISKRSPKVDPLKSCVHPK